jgi:hypothetical protein
MFFKKGVNLMSWVNAVTIGWFLGFVLLLILSNAFEAMGVENEQFILGLAMGTGVSVMEWQALKKAGIGFRWIILTGLGLAVPFLIQSIIGFEFPKSYEYAVLPIMIGIGALIVGITQFSLLKSKGIKAGTSIQFTMLAWLLPVVMVNGASLIPKDVMPNIVLFLINLLAILGSGPIYAILKFQIVKPLFPETPVKD